VIHMVDSIRVTKSPIVQGIDELLSISFSDSMTFNVSLPNGMIITNPEQFPDGLEESLPFSDDAIE
jgi:hypothetical protein